VEQPFLWIRLQEAGGVPAEYLKTARTAVYELGIEGANHGSVEDWDYLEAASPAQRNAADKILQIIRRYVDAFLSKHLNRQNSDLLEPGSKKPDLQWRVYVPAASSNSSPKQP
jgi:hypothetical protein